MDEHHVTMDMAIQKKQYIQICSLDLQKQSTFKFAELAKLLDINEDDVEEWSIDCITNNIIDARINQMNEEVVIKTHKLRSMSNKEWAAIKNQI